MRLTELLSLTERNQPRSWLVMAYFKKTFDDSNIDLDLEVEDENTIHISWIHNRGDRGNGTKALTHLMSLCDKFSITVTLTWDWSGDQPNGNRLGLYYQKFGFIYDGATPAQAKPESKDDSVGYSMHRMPKTNLREEDDGPVRIKLRGHTAGGDMEAIESFMRDWDDLTNLHPMYPSARMYGGVKIEMRKWRDGVYLSDITQLGRKGKGTATEVLSEIKEISNRYGVPIYGVAKAYSEDGDHITTTPRLVDWYRKNGFEVGGGSDDDGYKIKYTPVITESLQSEMPAEIVTEPTSNGAIIAFKLDDDYFEVKIEGTQGDWEVAFSRNHEMGITGGGNATKVFGTVSTVIKNFLKDKPVESISFSAHKPQGGFGSLDERRTRLYKRIAQRIAADMPGFKASIASKPNHDVITISK